MTLEHAQYHGADYELPRHSSEPDLIKAVGSDLLLKSGIPFSPSCYRKYDQRSNPIEFRIWRFPGGDEAVILAARWDGHKVNWSFGRVILPNNYHNGDNSLFEDILQRVAKSEEYLVHKTNLRQALESYTKEF